MGESGTPENIGQTLGKVPRCLDFLGVRSRHVMEWIDVEPVWLLCPERADVFERREAFQGLEALGEVIGVEEGFQVDP